MSRFNRAIQIDRYGGPETLVRRRLPIPVPAPGKVLVRLAHSGINFMDVHTRQGEVEILVGAKIGTHGVTC